MDYFTKRRCIFLLSAPAAFFKKAASDKRTCRRDGNFR